jgi:hypothetical protein
MTPSEALDRARESFGRQAWSDACAQFAAADRQSPLEPEDLERTATAAYPRRPATLAPFTATVIA